MGQSIYLEMKKTGEISQHKTISKSSFKNLFHVLHQSKYNNNSLLLVVMFGFKARLFDKVKHFIPHL